MEQLHLKHFGPIQQAQVMLGDLNISVGPQASGKSLFWQLFKLVSDAPAVREEFLRFNIDWGKDSKGFLNLYFGEGMQYLFSGKTRVATESKSFDLETLFDRRKNGASNGESVFYIPAQRVMAVRDGLTRSFQEFRAGDPFVVREFSDKLHNLVQSEFAQTACLFPQANRLNSYSGCGAEEAGLAASMVAQYAAS
ncbi:hypothetical protein V8J88_19440 [Massilia sp. W12]|uniref:hypothetical protein n=1 Tax=Massilia sp. W12 TaxID=3126507 RepID=UPI0030CCF78F